MMTKEIEIAAEIVMRRELALAVVRLASILSTLISMNSSEHPLILFANSRVASNCVVKFFEYL